MAVTRSTARERARTRRDDLASLSARNVELAWLAAASLFLAAGLLLVYQAQTRTVTVPQRVLNLSTVERSEQLIPFLEPAFPNMRERQAAAKRVYDLVRDEGAPPNVGALARLRTPEGERLFSYDTIVSIKPTLIVRTWESFRNRFLVWSLAFFAAFYAVHFVWRLRGFTGAPGVLPVIHVLCGMGLILMVSLRDPLRDTLSFAQFAEGVVLGSAAMLVASLIDYPQRFARFSFLPLLAAFLLSTALILFGTGPGASDAKVNLLGFQPVEVIKILLVFFFAGYFASRWEFLRQLKERRPELARLSQWVHIPRLEYVLPVVAAVGLMLLFFFLQRDLGPALVITCLFLAMYAVARNHVLLASAGFAMMAGGFATGYLLGVPRTVAQRVQMWLSPWDNAVRGGEQVVHSLWAMATGGLFGTGLGLGEPEFMPAAHTDLVLSGIGEEWGFLGVLVVFLLYAALASFGLRVALKARSDYAFFLALGLTVLVALEILLISGGVLDLLPLSGVVTPFLSYGRSAMIGNFVIFGILLSLSRGSGDRTYTQPFHGGIRVLAMALGVAGLAVLGKAAWVQVVRADAYAGAGTLTLQADGQRRFQYNPRVLTIARAIPRGDIFDRNGLPLATSDCAVLRQHRGTYANLGIKLPDECSASRQYPLGAIGFHLLGDIRTRANWGARNSSYAERDSTVRLQGYDDRARVVDVPDFRTGKSTYTIQYDYQELMPLLRHRHDPDHPEVQRILSRPRDLRMSIDAPLQVRAAEILRAGLKKLGRERGAAVIMDAVSGDLLASVSYPWPSTMPPMLAGEETAPEFLDRARYGLYPPGSTFKVVTAMAALRKDPESARLRYVCQRLPDGRVGNFVKGWGRPIRDDISDKTPHGSVEMERGLVVSCNAYFAQLATLHVGAGALHETADLLGIAVARPNTPGQLRDSLPQAGYGQGQVIASPFQMARVAATVAHGGVMPYGRWIADETNPRVQSPQRLLDPHLNGLLARYMRGVVTGGTGRAAASASVPVAGKTGTAEIAQGPSHAWFIGFAPATGPRQVAFAVLIENGQYGGSAAAPIAAQLVNAAVQVGALRSEE